MPFPVIRSGAERDAVLLSAPGDGSTGIAAPVSFYLSIHAPSRCGTPQGRYPAGVILRLRYDKHSETAQRKPGFSCDYDKMGRVMKYAGMREARPRGHGNSRYGNAGTGGSSAEKDRRGGKRQSALFLK